MAGAGAMTHSQLAALLVEGCLAHIGGHVQGKVPVKPQPATELERASVGLKQGGQTLFYPLAQGGVYVDLSGAVATVWYVNGDYDRGLETLDASLKHAPKVKQLEDKAQPVPKHRARTYEVELGAKRLATVTAEYAERGAQPERFLVRVVAQVRK
jgi:hypothetical protein